MGGFDQIEHVVVVMLENRSFDPMAGAIPGVNGIVVPHSKGRCGLAPTANSLAGHWKLAGGELELNDFYNLEDPKDTSSRKIPDDMTSGTTGGGRSRSSTSEDRGLCRRQTSNRQPNGESL